MDRDSITNLLENSSKAAFDPVVDVILEHESGLHPVHVDGKGDGGVDRRLYRDGGGATSAAAAVTTQGADWKA